jgi:hypothetical protein
MDPVPDPLLLRKSGRPENRTRGLWICSQELRPLDHRGGPIINVTKNILENNTEIQSKIWREIIYILKVIIEQNYIQSDQKYCKQTEGLAMGAPTSAILAETFIQHMEHEYLYPILIAHEIIAYYRCVDDIFIIYEQNKTNIEQTLYEFNNITTFHKVYHGKRTTQKSII